MWLRRIWNLYQLRKNLWKTPAELQKIQQKKLRAILRHAYDKVEFYHKRFRDVGIKPDDIKSIEDLPKLPITTKSDIKANFRNRKIVNPEVDLSRCHLVKTAGTSGEPMTIAYDERAEDFQKAVAVRCFREIGVGLRDKWAIITSPTRALARKDWFQKLNVLSPTFLSVFDPPSKYLPLLRKLKPDIIGGPSYSVWLLAKAVRENKAFEIKPKVVYGTSEPLNDKVREFINSSFGVEMFDVFGCVEVGRTAWECEAHKDYHMDVDAVAIEVVDMKGNEQVASEEKGRILYTSLYNYAMPLIRYDVHDMCTLSNDPCPCGRGLPMMKEIIGRTDDLLISPNGVVLPPGIWSISMRALQGIMQYRIIQKTKRKFVMEFVADQDFTSETPSEARKELKRILGAGAEVEVKVVEEMPKDKSGKLRSIISEVKNKVAT